MNDPNIDVPCNCRIGDGGTEIGRLSEHRCGNRAVAGVLHTAERIGRDVNDRVQVAGSDADIEAGIDLCEQSKGASRTLKRVSSARIHESRQVDAEAGAERKVSKTVDRAVQVEGLTKGVKVSAQEGPVKAAERIRGRGISEAEQAGVHGAACVYGEEEIRNVAEHRRLHISKRLSEDVDREKISLLPGQKN